MPRRVKADTTPASPPATPNASNNATLGDPKNTKPLTAPDSRPLGIRHNNPGNIEWIPSPTKRWRGMVGRGVGNAARYGVFDTAMNGIRAIGGELSASIRKGQNTVAQVINEWAPPSENNTSAYVEAVAKALGVSAHQPIDVFSNKGKIALAIIQHENGVQPYRPSDVLKWVNLA